MPLNIQWPMKDHVYSSVLAFLLALLGTPAFAAEVVVPDAALKSAIWESLGRALPVGNLTEQDMLSLTNLDATMRGASSVEGLAAAYNLRTLYLGFNQLTDFSPLSGMTNLTSLVVFNNQLTTFTLPAGLTSLTNLDLRANALTSLTLPEWLTSLTTLHLNANQLEDLILPKGSRIYTASTTIN